MFKILSLNSFDWRPRFDQDDESKELILQVVKKAVKLHKMARYLVEQCGLFSWLSSVLSILSESHFRDEKSLFLLQLGVVSEVVNDVISSRNMTEWLQKYALEQLMELTSHLYKFLVSYMALIKQKVAVVNPILGIIISTLKISQKRRIYQPHFILSIEGSYNIYKAVKICDNTRSCATAELGLHAILMSAPPVAIFCLVMVVVIIFVPFTPSFGQEASHLLKLLWGSSFWMSTLFWTVQVSNFLELHRIDFVGLVKLKRQFLNLS